MNAVLAESATPDLATARARVAQATAEVEHWTALHAQKVSCAASALAALDSADIEDAARLNRERFDRESEAAAAARALTAAQGRLTAARAGLRAAEAALQSQHDAACRAECDKIIDQLEALMAQEHALRARLIAADLDSAGSRLSQRAALFLSTVHPRLNVEGVLGGRVVQTLDTPLSGRSDLLSAARQYWADFNASRS